MADVLVLNHNHGLHHFARRQREGPRAERRNHLAVAALAESEDIDVEIVPGSQKLDCLFKLLIEAIVERHGGVAGWPAMRNEGAVFRARLREYICGALHVASLARSEIGLIK